MATVTHYIRSHYDPKDREALERETAQFHDSQPRDVDPDEEWRREASQMDVHRPKRRPPQFVPATVNDDYWNFTTPTPGPSKSERPSTTSLGTNLSGWYRSLTSKQPEQNSPSSTNSKVNSSPNIRTPSTFRERVNSPAPMNPDLPNKNNWFIMKAMQSEHSASSSSSPAPTLADILAREPPPLPSEPKFTPPVFLEIGPSNRGFGMLQRSGWNEGEPLGPDVIRRKPVQDVLPDEDAMLFKNKGKGRSHQSLSQPISHRKVVEVKMEDFDDVSELRSVDVIDLTLSDSDIGEDESCPNSEDNAGKREEESTVGEANEPFPGDRIDDDVHSPYRRKALLTPIGTVLKSDKLGIGLKAKTEGIYKTSKKRVTHSAAALAAHVKAAEESRLRRKHYGRGRRGFDRQHRREEEKRKEMLAHLKGL